jgi:hypothetical protein
LATFGSWLPSSLLGVPSERARNGRILVSYVLYAPFDKTNEEWCRQCLENVDIFITRAVASDENGKVHFLFSLVGKETYPTPLLKSSIQKLPNVKINVRENSKDTSTDLYVQGDVLHKSIHAYDYFFLLNCGVKGPYIRFPTGMPTLDWLDPFMAKFDQGAKAVGATISCEISPHIQTYTMVLDRDSAKVVIPLWLDGSIMKDKNRLAVIANAEVGASQLFLEKNYKIDSLDWHYKGRDFRKKGRCDPYYCDAENRFFNPVACWPGDEISPGCYGVEPCEVIFVKTGGDILRLGAYPKVTAQRVAAEEALARNSSRLICTDIPKTNRNRQMKPGCEHRKSKGKRRSANRVYDTEYLLVLVGVFFFIVWIVLRLVLGATGMKTVYGQLWKRAYPDQRRDISE